MTSDDISRIELLLREHFARTDKQLSDMRAENAEFRTQMMKDFHAFEEKVDKRFDRLETKVEVMQNNITELKHSVSDIHFWNYWTLSIVIALLAMPQIATGIKSLFGALTDVISAVARILRKEDKA